MGVVVIVWDMRIVLSIRTLYQNASYHDLATKCAEKVQSNLLQGTEVEMTSRHRSIFVHIAQMSDHS